MKALFYGGCEFQAERIVKTEDSITGYNGNNEVFSFRGISDFSDYQLADGQEWDKPQPTIEEIQRQMAERDEVLADIMGGAIYAIKN